MSGQGVMLGLADEVMRGEGGSQECKDQALKWADGERGVRVRLGTRGRYWHRGRVTKQARPWVWQLGNE